LGKNLLGTIVVRNTVVFLNVLKKRTFEKHSLQNEENAIYGIFVAIRKFLMPK